MSPAPLPEQLPEYVGVAALVAGQERVEAEPRPQPRPPQQPQPLALPGELQRGGRVQPEAGVAQLQAEGLPPTQPQEEAQGVEALATGLSLQLVRAKQLLEYDDFYSNFDTYLSP